MSNDGMKETDKLAANAADPHQYGDNERDHDYLMAVDVHYRIDYYLSLGLVDEARREAGDERQRRWESGDEWDDDDE